MQMQATRIRRAVLTVALAVPVCWSLIIVPLTWLHLVPMGDEQSANNIIFFVVSAILLPIHVKWPQASGVVGSIYFAGLFYIATSAQFLTPADSLRPLLFFPTVGAVFLIFGSTAGAVAVVAALTGFGSAVATGHLKLGLLEVSTFLVTLVVTALLFHMFRWQAIRALDTIAAQNAALDKVSREDPLTGLMNLRGFRQAMTARDAGRDRFAIAFLDIDHFKAINDRYGHHGGDTLLVAVAYRLANSLRPQDVLARIGGEEFAVLMPCDDAQEAARLGEHLRTAIATARLRLETDELAVTVSVGIAMSAPGLTADGALKAADGAMYLAKRRGRNQVVTAREGHTALGAAG